MTVSTSPVPPSDAGDRRRFRSWAEDVASAVGGDGRAVGGEEDGAAAQGHEMHAEAGVEADGVAGTQADRLARAVAGRGGEDAVGRVVIDGVAVERGVEVDEGAARRAGGRFQAAVIEGQIVSGGAQRDEEGCPSAGR